MTEQENKIEIYPPPDDFWIFSFIDWATCEGWTHIEYDLWKRGGSDSVQEEQQTTVELIAAFKAK